MKKVHFVIVFLLSALAMSANVTFKFSPNSISAGTLKTRMENNLSALLTEIDNAGKAARGLNLSGINMESSAKMRLEALWRDARFTCDKITNIANCLNDFQGFQVRGIRITMKPADGSYGQSLNRELTVSLNKSGVITGVRLAHEDRESVSKIMGEGTAVDDMVRRREILKFVEDFRCYYNERNLKALRQIYSDDALIITGSVVSQRKTTSDIGSQMVNCVKYKTYSKQEYMNNLNGIFNRNKHIDVKFDNISVMRHGAKPNIYGVTLHQKWRTSTYSDDGWLFLLWDFTDPEKPQIHVRTWQPDQAVAMDGKFSLDDFLIP